MKVSGTKIDVPFMKNKAPAIKLMTPFIKVNLALCTKMKALYHGHTQGNIASGGRDIYSKGLVFSTK